MEQKKQLHEWIEEHATNNIDRLQKMVQLKSTQGEEKAMQQYVAEILNDLGLEVDLWDLDGERLAKNKYFYSNRSSFENSPNVVGVLKGTGGGKSIILNGHVDVVPEGDHQQWDEDPYSGKVMKGNVFGRGATDMKGGNIAMIMAIEAIKSLNLSLKGNVIFQSVIEEESGGAGTLDAILQGYKADAAIIPEPTNMKIFPKQQGSKWFRLIVTGRTAHGGTRYHGISAIDKAFIVNEHVHELEKIRNARLDEPLYDHVPIPIPINIGSIKGGDWPSSVPDIVQLEGRIGIAPGETMEQVQIELEDWIARLVEKDDWFKEYPVKLEWYGARWVPGEIELSHPLMNILSKNYSLVTDEAPVVEASPWGTDGGLLTQVAQTPTIVFGPGTTNLAHFPNEAIELKKIVDTAKIIAATVVDWCEVNK